jgi:hypothetical protein
MSVDIQRTARDYITQDRTFIDTSVRTSDPARMGYIFEIIEGMTLSGGERIRKYFRIVGYLHHW